MDKHDFIVAQHNQCGICWQHFRSTERYEAHYINCRAKRDSDLEKLRIFRNKRLTI